MAKKPVELAEPNSLSRAIATQSLADNERIRQLRNAAVTVHGLLESIQPTQDSVLLALSDRQRWSTAPDGESAEQKEVRLQLLEEAICLERDCRLDCEQIRTKARDILLLVYRVLPDLTAKLPAMHSKTADLDDVKKELASIESVANRELEQLEHDERQPRFNSIVDLAVACRELRAECVTTEDNDVLAILKVCRLIRAAQRTIRAHAFKQRPPVPPPNVDALPLSALLGHVDALIEWCAAESPKKERKKKNAARIAFIDAYMLDNPGTTLAAAVRVCNSQPEFQCLGTWTAKHYHAQKSRDRKAGNS